ncbi:MAG TPA: hypothetical protein VH643_16835 [Gemmataceae bacterium]
MFRSLWFHKLLGLKSRSVRRRQASQTRRAVRLVLEGLEDRITPAGLPFATPGNATQLLADFTFANANPNQAVTINLEAGGTYDLTDIGSELVSQSKAGITINGNGATINAALNTRVFEVENGDKLVLNNVTVTGGNVTQTTSSNTKGGGGILDAGGFLTLSGASVTGNAVRGGDADGDGFAQGGGIYVSGAGTLTMKNGASVSNNKAIGSTQFGFRGQAQGGGVYVTGSGAVSITNSTINSNLARGGNGNSNTYSGGADASGGGLYMYGGSVVNITNSIINNNHVQGGNGTGTTGAHGGDARGGGTFISGSGWKVSITGTTVNDNTATGGAGAKGFKEGQEELAAMVGHNGGAGGSASGAGAFVFGNGAGFNVLSSSFNGNIAQGGAGGQGGPGSDGGKGGDGGNGGSAFGGGLFYETFGSGLKITGTSFDSNQAIGGNGGLGGRGGVGSRTGGDGGAGGNGGAGEGGGIWLYADGAVTIVNSSVTNNNATGGTGGDGGVGGTGGTNGGAGGQGGNGGSGSGGGIFVSVLENDMFVINTTIGANTAQGGNAGAGGVGGNAPLDANHGAHGGAGLAGSAFGGGLENFRHESMDLINDTIAFNVAQAGSGGSNNPESQGGGVDGHSSVEMINVMLTGNIATDGPDYFGFVGAGSHHDFVSNTDGIFNLNLLKFGVGNILNNQNPQLGPLQGPGPNAGDTAWYPLLANSAAINAGSLSVQADIANAQGVPIADITDQIGNPRVNANGFIDIGSVAFFLATTTITVPPVTVTQTSSPTQVQLTADIASQTGEMINEGQVTFTVTDSSNNPVGGPVTTFSVVNGVATASFTVPGNQPVGSYTITAKYTDPQNGGSGGRFGDSTGTGTLSVNTTPASTTVKAGNASVDVSTSPQPVNVVALVNSPAGTVNEGNVTVTLFDKTNNPVATGSASVSGGSASVSITVPANFAAGSYQMQESYTDGTDFGGSSDFGTLTVVNPVSQPQSPMPVTVVNTPLSTSGTTTVTNTVTTTTNNDLNAAIALFMDVIAFVLDQNGFSSISAAFNLPTSTTDAFNLAVAKFNEVGGTLGATVIPMASQAGANLVTSLQGK